MLNSFDVCEYEQNMANCYVDKEKIEVIKSKIELINACGSLSRKQKVKKRLYEKMLQRELDKIKKNMESNGVVMSSVGNITF
jgi:hypothetical protein